MVRCFMNKTLLEKKPFQFWREIWIQVLVVLLLLYQILHSASELAEQEIEIKNNWQCAKWAKKHTK